MDAIGDIFVALLEAVIRLLYGVIRLIIRAIGLVLSQSWLSDHFEGMRRFGWWLAVAMSTYLVFGICRSMFEPLWTPALTPFYQWQIVIAAMFLLLVGIAMRELDKANFVPDNTRHKFEPDRFVATNVVPTDDSPIRSQPSLQSSGIVAAIVFGVLCVGAFSAITSERHEATLAKKLCAQADARISEGVENAVRDGAGLLDRVLGTRTADRIPCADD